MRSETGSRAPSGSRAARLHAMAKDHWSFVGRMLRNLGVHPNDLDDAAQGVFLVAIDKLDAIVPGKERSFLGGAAVRVAARFRRARAVARARDAGDDATEVLAEGAASADDRLDDARALAILDAAIADLPLKLRGVLVLHEVEELTTSEIAEALGVPAGTVASRLRLARAHLRRNLTGEESDS